MTFYTVALFIHIIGVLSLFGAISLEVLMVSKLGSALTTAQVRLWVSISPTMEKIFPIALLLIVVAGIYMASVAWGWTTPWIDTAFTLVVLVAILGPTVNVSRLKAIEHMAVKGPEGPVPPVLTARIQDPVLWTSVMAMFGAMLGNVMLMTLKPDLLLSLIIVVVMSLLGAAYGQLIRPRQKIMEERS